MTYRVGLLNCLLLAAGAHANAQFGSFKAKLKPQTIADFTAYARKAEAKMDWRWNGNGPFLEIDEDPAARAKVLGGNLLIRPGIGPNPHAIPDGLIHDWYGVIYIANSKVARVVGVLQDFDHHSTIYPQVVKSRLINRRANDVTGYWRLEEKGQVVAAVFDVTQTSHYMELSPDRWASISHADNIQAVEDHDSNREKVLAPGQGLGLMWKLYSYWTLEQIGSGVLAECRTISLSRGIPAGVAWMIRPFINNIPRESMSSTLENTRKASSE